MGEIRNLEDNKAVDKIIDLVGDKMCVLCTTGLDGEISTRPMSIAQIEKDGSIWFFSPKNSNKNREIMENSKVYLIYMEASRQHYLTLAGDAEIVFDRDKVDELWNGFLKAWFTGGKEDPNISLLKITPQEGHYWDEKEGHLISMVKTTIAAITGTKGLDGSLQGDLAINQVED